MAGNRVNCVIDASVIVKWYFQNEENSENSRMIAKDFLDRKINIAVPSHSFFEVMNAILLKKSTTYLTFLSQLLAAGMVECPLTLELTSVAASIVEKFPKVSFYDAVYHALAIELRGVFITADEKYYQKAKSLKHIQLLENYKPA